MTIKAILSLLRLPLKIEWLSSSTPFLRTNTGKISKRLFSFFVLTVTPCIISRYRYPTNGATYLAEKDLHVRREDLLSRITTILLSEMR